MTLAVASVGLWSISHVLGDIVRTNDWWDSAIVDQWRTDSDATRGQLHRAVERAEGVTKLALEAIAQDLDDPFKRTKTRGVLSEQRTVAEFATTAAVDALAKASLGPADVDVLLSFDFCPDLLGTNNAATLHQQLGLRRECLALSVDAGANSFLAHLYAAASFVASGAARTVLIVQSAVCSRLLPYTREHSVLFGDACTAAVVGRVKPGFGIRSFAHQTDGTLQGTLVAGVPEKHWWDDGKVVMYTLNTEARARMFATLPVMAVEGGNRAMKTAGIMPSDVGFYASHQGVSWVRPVTQQALGLIRSSFADTFSWTGNVIACNAPIALSVGHESSQVRDGDIVLVWAGGNGITHSSAVLKWGGRDD